MINRSNKLFEIAVKKGAERLEKSILHQQKK